MFSFIFLLVYCIIIKLLIHVINLVDEILQTLTVLSVNM